jgi:hypothetical protein
MTIVKNIYRALVQYYYSISVKVHIWQLERRLLKAEEEKRKKLAEMSEKNG